MALSTKKPAVSGVNPFLPIYLESLMIDTILDFDLFIRLGRDMVLYRSKLLPFTERTRQKLMGNNVMQLFVPVTAKGEYQRYIETNLSRIVQDPLIEEEKKAAIVYDASKALVKDVLANPNLGENIHRSQSLVSTQVSYILSGREAFLNLMRITSFDYYTYTHSVNVCTFAIALANQLGITNSDELKTLGQGALLHDVGKSRISERILKKKSSLNNAEIEIIRKHPRWGQEILKESDIIPETAYYPVLQHHERIDGSGYPYGVAGHEIHDFGKIVAICDVFDALTTRRVYQNAMGSYPALKEMYNKGAAYDERFLREFTVLMGPDNYMSKK
ncbi:MAG: HD-GYP domain-containing protein [Candidatus Zixiibacteriota bacterium]